jgi:hypothetical protein
MLLECMLLLLRMLSLVLEGLLVDYSLFVLELESLLQGRLLVGWGILLVLLGGGGLELLWSIASVSPGIDRGWHSGPGHGCGGVESRGEQAGPLLYGRAAINWS